MDAKRLRGDGMRRAADGAPHRKPPMGGVPGSLPGLTLRAVMLLMVLAVSFAAPTAAYADGALNFWSDPLGSIASVFGLSDGSADPAGDAQPHIALDESAVADASTIEAWKNFLLNEQGHATTENIGRIWNDKSVFSEDVTLIDGTPGGIPVAKGDSDFLVALSALSSMSNTTATTVNPLDIVIVLDDSGSMDDPFGATSSAYLPVYDIDYDVNLPGIHTRPEYCILDEAGRYVKLDYVEDLLWPFDPHYTRNGQRVNPKTGPNDSDPSHVQFYEHVNGDSCKAALQIAVANFIDRAADVNAQMGDSENKIQISTVEFSSNSSTLQGLTVCEGDGADLLKASLCKLDSANSTRADLGLQTASSILQGGRPNARKVVIFFTDGEPNDMSGFDADVADAAIDNALGMKRAGATVYSIGVFGGADPGDTTGQVNAYMHGVSSNYPDATSYTADKLGERAPGSNYYLTASNPEGLDKVFEGIFNDVSSGTGSPTEIEEGFDAAHSGYITFTDRLDAYMRVDGFKCIVFADEKFEKPQVSTAGNTTTYVFEGATSTPIYPSGNLRDIKITVERSDDLATGDLVTVRIPASLIPVRNFKLDTDKGTMAVDEVFPICAFYGVSLKDNVAEALATSNAGGAISAEDYGGLEAYVAAHGVDGKAAFYSNDWISGDVGATVASFSPSPSNSFYFFTKDTPVYKDEACQQRASVDDVKQGLTYFRWEFCESDGAGGYEPKTKIYKLNADFEINQAYWDVDDQGRVYVKAGTPHLTRTNDFFTEKKANESGTVKDAQNPEWGEDNRTMNSRLGNNGRLLVELPGTLSVTKRITADPGLDAAQFDDVPFTFDIELRDAAGAPVSGSFPAQVQNARGEVVSDRNFALEFANGRATHPVKPDETLRIFGLTAGWTYTVTEAAMPPGFSQASATGAAGAIVADTVSSAAFANNYSAAPLEYDTSAGFQVEKVLTGRDWRDDDGFAFTLTATGGAPAADRPTAAIAGGSAEHKASFGTITFERPGEYAYLIEEDDAAPIVGIGYSAATYQVTVKAIDDGEGRIEVDAVTLERIKDDDGRELGTPTAVEGGIATFTNAYLSDSGATNISGTKDYIDATGGNPLANGMFTFEMRAKGGYVTDSGSADGLTIGPDAAPMPAGSTGDASTVANTAGTFSFPSISFDGDDVGNTYVYEVREVIPAGAEANGDGGYTLNGMAYDATVHTLAISVAERDDPGNPGHAHVVATPSMSPEELVFTNSYDADPAVLAGATAIKGSKTLNGRDMRAGEFEFRLVPTGGTLTAIDGGAVAGIAEDGLTATVPAAESGRAAEFAFGAISFDKPGVYTFDMTEAALPEGGGGLTPDRHVGKVAVRVSLDAENARLVASVDYGTHEGRAGNAFVNTYSASMDYGASGGLEVTKTLSGRPMRANEFNFTIDGIDAEGSVPAGEANDRLAAADRAFGNPTSANDGVALVMNKLGGVRFDQDDAGKTFTYEVRETAGDAGGVTYDDTAHIVAIRVIDDGDGTMRAVTTVTDGQGGAPVVVDSADAGGTVPTVAFANTYEASEVSIDGSGIAGTKTLDGRDGMDGETFGFTLTRVGGPQDGCTLVGTTQASVGGLVNGVPEGFDFRDARLTFSKVGTYTFRVGETSWNGAPIPAEATRGMTFDAHEGTATVVVEDDGRGRLTARVACADMGFVNTYVPEGITFDVSTAVRFHKQVTGRAWLESDSFTFEVSAGPGTPMPAPATSGAGRAASGGETRSGVTLGNAVRVTLDGQSHAEGEQVEIGLGGILYTQADLAGAPHKTFSYTVTEIHPVTGGAIPGMDYSGAAFRVDVTVTDNLDGTLSASAKAFQTEDQSGIPIGSVELEAGASATFVNTYSADSATVIPSVTEDYTDKTGSRPLADGMFSIKIAPMGENAATAPMPEGTTGEGADRVYAVGNAGSAFAVPNLVFEQHDGGKTFTYRVTEDVPVGAEDNGDGTATLDGMTYDAEARIVVIKVAIDETSGAPHVVAEVTGIPESGIVFANSYDAADLQLVGNDAVKVQKTLDGRDSLQGERFGFQLKLVGGDPAGVSGLADGATTAYVGDLRDGEPKVANFGSLTFSRPGAYRFDVTETAPSADGDGMTRDAHTSKVSVTVIDDNGRLALAEGSPAYDNGQAATEADRATIGAAAFTNVYRSVSVSVAGAEFGLTKQLAGRAGSAWAEGDSFTFVLTGEDGAPMPADAEGGSKSVTVTKGDVTDLGNGIATIDFGAIEYTAAGTCTYTVVEANAGKTINGVTHANNTVTVTVTVTDNGVGGLVAAVAKTGESKDEAGEGASFVNAYSSTVMYGDVGGLDVTKVLHGRDMTAGQFTFTVTSEDKDALDKIGGKDVTMSSAAADAGAAAPVTGNPFDAIVFNRSDSGKSFTYHIDEVQEGGDGYICDASEYTVTITPHDNGDGTMSVTTSVEDGDGEHNMTVENATSADKKTAVVPFDNTYAAGPTTVGAEGDAAIAARKTLKNADIANYAGMFNFVVTSGGVTVATGANAADGTVTFGNIAYTSANLYEAAHGGSAEVGTATLAVTDDADVYTFNYNVAEDTANLPEGVSYESGAGTVAVTVTDDRAGTLSATVAYGDGEGGLEFVNVYGASERARLTLTGAKSIVGVDGAIPPALTDGMFGFAIAGSAGAPMPDVTYVENTGATVAFGPISYTMENVFGASGSAGSDEAVDESAEAGGSGEAGAEAAAEGVEPSTACRTETFTYTITEDAAKTVPGVTNDATPKTVEVTVTDNGDGTLTAAVTKVSEGTAQGMDFSFANTCSVTPIEQAPTGDGGLTVTKIWDKRSGSRELAAGDFAFAMLDGAGNVVSQGVNDAEGDVALSAVKYTAAGRHAYTLIEVVPDDAKPVEGGYEKDGVLYDAASYAVTATVVDNHDGTLGITWTMRGEDGIATDTAAFVNVYRANPATVTFGAAASLEGRALRAGEFAFELKEADGTVLGTAENAADGSIVFPDAIQTFDSVGAHDFTVSQVLPADDDPGRDGIQRAGVTYDETVYTAHVVIADDGKGNLQIAELTYGGKAELPVFRNSYAESAAPEDPAITPGDSGGSPADVTPGGRAEGMPATGDGSLPPIVGAAALGAACVLIGIAVKSRRG